MTFFFLILVLWFDALFKNKRYIKNPSPVVFSPRQILRQMIGAHSYQTPCFRACPQHQVSFILYSIAKNCAELYKSGRRISGVYTIDPDGSGAFDVYCDHTTAGGGWTVIQKRMDGSVDFNRTWNEYKDGFGNLVGEFWLGLDKINRLTRNKTKNKLRVDLGVKNVKTVHPEYSWFGIGNETAEYQLYIGNFISKWPVFLAFIVRFSYITSLSPIIKSILLHFVK